MPNWCDNSVCVYGDEKEIKLFYKRLEKAEEQAQAKKEWLTYNLYKQHHYKKDEILKNDNYIGGYLTGMEEPHKSKGVWALYFFMDTRWSPMIDGMRELMRHYKTLNCEVRAEEGGMGIYVNTDTEKQWFADEYYLYDSENGSEYFDDYTSLAQHLKKVYGVSLTKKQIDDEYHFSLNNECEQEVWIYHYLPE